jgi:hypothetical protein
VVLYLVNAEKLDEGQIRFFLNSFEAVVNLSHPLYRMRAPKDSLIGLNLAFWEVLDNKLEGCYGFKKVLKQETFLDSWLGVCIRRITGQSDVEDLKTESSYNEVPAKVLKQTQSVAAEHLGNWES